MPRHSFALLTLFALGLAALAGAAPARADELLVAVERTAGSAERPGFALRSSLPGTVTVSLDRVERPDLFLRQALADRDPRQTEGLAAALAAYEDLRRQDPAARTAPAALRAASLSLQPPANRSALQVDVEPLAAGLYTLTAEQQGLSARALLLVSDLAVVTKRDATGLMAFTVERVAGAPRAGVQVEVWGGRSLLASGTSDADGLVRLRGSFPSSVRVVAHSGADWALASERWFPAATTARRVWMVTHQPAYRPGERVEVRGVLRAVGEDGVPTVDASVRRLKLRFVAANQTVLGEAEAEVHPEFGTFSAGFATSAQAVTGEGEVLAEVEGDLYAAPLVIDAYRRPTVDVRVTPAAPRVLSGERVAFAVEARGYDGSALPGARTTWTLVHHRVDRDLFPEDEFVRLFFGSEREAFAPTPLAQGEGVLDARSNLAVAAALPADLAGGFVTLRAVVVGADGVHVAGSGVCGVSSAPITVGVETDRHLVGPEDTVRATVRVERADGVPAAARPGTLRLLRDGDAPNQPQTEVLRLPFHTDERGAAGLDVPLPGGGAYRLVAEVPRVTPEPPGASASASRRLWAVGEQATLGYAGKRLEVVADKDAYAAGETARLLVLSPLAGRALLCTLEGATLLDVRVLTPRGNAALYTVALQDAHAPNVWASFTSVDHGNLLSGARVLRVPPLARLLRPQIQVDAAELAPGALSGATVTVRDVAGAPVAGAEVSLAVVDEALHALFPDVGASLEAFFHPLRRNGVSTGAAPHVVSVGRAFRAAPPPSPSPGPRPEGAAPLTDAPPPGAAPLPQEAPRPPESPAPQPSAGAPGSDEDSAGADVRGLGLSGPPELLERQRALAPGKKGLGDGVPSSGETRADFRSAVFWAPSLRTDVAGRARVEGIAYADTLTRWRLTAHAVDARTRVGSARAQVRTKKDLSVDVGLPRFLRVADRLEAPLLVTNLTARELSAVAGARWAMDTPPDASPEVGPVALPAGVATRQGTLAVEPTRVGTLHVLASAHAADAGDRLRRTLPVLPQGIDVSHAVSGDVRPASGDGRVPLELNLPPDLEPSSLSARVVVESSVLAAVLRALPYLVDYPYGCTEQTLSRFEPLLVAAEALEALGLPRQGALAEVAPAVVRGVERLAQLQNAEGGFGWWPGEAAQLEMTARAVRGLVRARRTPQAAPAAEAVLSRAIPQLQALLNASRLEEAPAASLALLALAEAGALPAGALERALDTLAAEGAGSLSLALYLRAALVAQRRELASSLSARLLARATRDARGLWFGTSAEGGRPPERWQHDPLEATAGALLALLEAGAPRRDLADGARWLLAQRVGDGSAGAGTVWRSTRDSAAAVAFLAAYGASEVLASEGRRYRVLHGEQVLGEVETTRAALLSGGVTLAGALLHGARTLSLVVEGPGAFSATLSVSGVATGPAIAQRDAGLRVERRWFALEASNEPGRTLHRRVPVTETVAAGTLLECELVVTTPWARDYVQVTSPHLAGGEPEREVALAVQGRSAATAAHVERYDERTEFFVTRLEAGTHVFRHLLRATHTGAFVALPARARLMYFPHVMGSSRGELIQITPETSPGAPR